MLGAKLASESTSSTDLQVEVLAEYLTKGMHASLAQPMSNSQFGSFNDAKHVLPRIVAYNYSSLLSFALERVPYSRAQDEV